MTQLFFVSEHTAIGALCPCLWLGKGNSWQSGRKPSQSMLLATADPSLLFFDGSTPDYGGADSLQNMGNSYLTRLMGDSMSNQHKKLQNST